VEEARTSYIFVFTRDIKPGDIPGLARGLTASQGGTLRHMYTKAIRGFSATLAEQAAARIGANPKIAYYERNAVAHIIGPAAAKKPANPGKGGDGTEEPPQVIPWGVTRVGGPVSGFGRNAWVIDTGIDLKHPDLNVGAGANFVLRGKNSPQDGNGHGTHVAGTIGAIDNAINVVGVAAGATVHPVRVLDNSGFGTIDAVVAGVDFVAANASTGDAANMSLGASGHFQSLHDAVVNTADLGIRFAISAGNDGRHADGYEPAHVWHPYVYTVSAMDSSDRFAGFSNYGNPPVDFAAPGVGVLSTKKGGGITTMSGTSMAAPHVAGLLLLHSPNADGSATGDPDGIPDPIAHY